MILILNVIQRLHVVFVAVYVAPSSRSQGWFYPLDNGCCLKRNRRGNSANWSGPELAALFVAAWWCPLLCVSFKSEDWVNSSQKLWMNTHTHYIYIYIQYIYIYTLYIWKFPEIGVPPNHLFYFRLVHETKHPFLWGTPLPFFVLCFTWLHSSNYVNIRIDENSILHIVIIYHIIT